MSDTNYASLRSVKMVTMPVLSLKEHQKYSFVDIFPWAGTKKMALFSNILFKGGSPVIQDIKCKWSSMLHRLARL